ncbi:MAG: bifunctional shikimate kinase/3-dehydroquinate synthase [Myxococcota bacterium]|nr:bifunctional shikimate kinase/3-dehydroquinate synthase [Myxococcota bacterium]
MSVSGPPGVGKSTLGKYLAENHGLNSQDLDQLVESHAGRKIEEIFQHDGEQVFRKFEADTLESLDASTDVLTLGGGALTTTITRRAARKRGLVMGLEAPIETIRQRLETSNSERPLLADSDSLGALLSERKDSYASVDIALDAVEPMDRIAQRVIDAATNTHMVHARVGDRESRVLIGRNIPLAVRGAVLHGQPKRTIAAVTDANVPRDFIDQILEPIREHLEIHEIITPGGEETKSWSFLGDALESAIEAGCGRQSTVVSIGGGATCDFGGLLAALLGRGAGLVMVPTTVVSQVDASVGGKTAVNMSQGRNLVGAFYPATDVIVDTDALESLPKEEYISGLAEVMKIGIISDPDLFEAVRKNPTLSPTIVAKAIAHKAAIVASDPFENGDRKLLNLGHTLGHALESASKFQMKHGDAVALGTAAIARLSAAKGWTSEAVRDQILSGLSEVGLPIEAPKQLLNDCKQFIGQDKKSDRQHVDLIIVRKLGKTAVMRLQLNSIVDELIHFGGLK